MERKYLLFETTEVGLGHLFSAILGVAYYAWKTGRVLALDMRRFHYVKNDKHATFLANFEFQFPPDLEVVTDLATLDRLRLEPDLHYLTMVDRLVTANPFTHKVLLVPCVTPGQPFNLEVKETAPTFRINLRGRLLEEWQRALSLSYWRGPVIGLHYRSTVGEVTERMTKELVPDYEERYRAVQDRYADTALAVAKQAGYEDPAFLVTSDDAGFVEYVKSRLPNSFSLATRLLDQEVIAYIRDKGHDIGILIDAVNDLWCLSACDQLVHYRSGFSDFAALNSPKLTAATKHYIHVPAFEEILQGFEPAKAVQWARFAVRKADSRRMELHYLHEWLADAYERAGDAAQAAMSRQRRQWHWDATTSPIVDVPQRHSLQQQVHRGDLTQPLANAQRVAAALPGNPYVLAGYGQSLGTLLMGVGRLDEALDCVRQAVALDPADAHLQHHLGQVLLRMQRWAEAEAALRAAVQRDADIAAFHSDLATALQRQGKAEAALAAAREATRLDPKAPHLLRRLGALLMQTGDVAAAEATFRQAIEAGSDAGGFIDLANVLARQGRMDDAIVAVQQAIAQEPQVSHWPHHLAHHLLNAGRVADAEVASRQAVELAGNDADRRMTRDMLAQLLERQGKLEDAVLVLREIIGIDPRDTSRYARLGNLLRQIDRFDDAAAALRQAIALRPSEVAYYDSLSVVLEQAQRPIEAAAAVQAALALAPQDAGRQEHLGRLLLHSEQFDAAAAALQHAVEHCPAHPNLFHLLSIVLQRQGQPHDAVEAARRASMLEPHQPDRRVHLAGLLMHAGRDSEAVAALRQAIWRRPNHATYHDRLSSVLERLGLGTEAAAALRDAVGVEPTALRLERFAQLLLRVGQPVEAVAALQRAAALDPSLPHVQENLAQALGRVEATRSPDQPELRPVPQAAGQRALEALSSGAVSEPASAEAPQRPAEKLELCGKSTKGTPPAEDASVSISTELAHDAHAT